MISFYPAKGVVNREMVGTVKTRDRSAFETFPNPVKIEIQIRQPQQQQQL
jgi:hypothetical protein